MDDGHLWLEFFVIIGLVLANAAFSLSEIAIVGARKTRLQEMADAGVAGAKSAIRLAENKEELFATIQVGITTIGIITGMYSGASFSDPLEALLRDVPLIAPYARTVAVVSIMAIVTYFSLIIGELVPKWVAVSLPERAACAIAGPMIFLSKLCKPIVIFSNMSTKWVVEKLGISMEDEQPVTEEEIKVLLEQGVRLGVFDLDEPRIVDNVFQLNDLTAAECMTARPKLLWIDLEEREDKLWQDLQESPHYRLLVGNGSLDEFKGFADVRRILLDQHIYTDKPLKASVVDTLRTPVYIPETLTLMKVLNLFRKEGVHEVAVIDEYGTLSGLLTLHDILEEILGAMPEGEGDLAEAQNKCIRRSDDSWLVEGLCDIDAFKETLEIQERLPGEDEYYKTVGGFLTYLFGYIPVEGEKVSWGLYMFEIVDCDNRRIDKVLVTEKESVREES